MRLNAGIFALILFLVNGVSAFGQVRGEVESVGFGPEGFYRPTCWTPMVVRLLPTSPDPFKGQIVVKQDDLDGDHVDFKLDFEIGGAHEGSNEGQRYWMYFIPSPRLPDLLGGPELSKQLQVFICNAAGKELTQLPVTCNLVKNLDGHFTGAGFPRGKRLLLCVTRDDKPEFSGYADAVGIAEDVQPVMIGEGNLSQLLPENPIGYESVDAVVWCNADPGRLTDKQRAALKLYVNRGGRFVILQTTKGTSWATVATGLGDLMPVYVKSTMALPQLDTFRLITADAIRRTYSTSSEEMGTRQGLLNTEPGKWDALKGTDVAIGLLKPGAIVDRWFNNVDPATPFIVRAPYGLGAVTWVAQDVADADLRQKGTDSVISENWALVWDRIFDYAHDTVPRHRFKTGQIHDDPAAVRMQPGALAGSSQIHLEHAMLTAMELPGTGTTLVGVAILFFIIYWAVGGPGAYFFLRYRQKSAMNWFAFALVALVATVVTVGIVRLVLRGSPQLRHVSFVRLGADGQGWARSEFGLYVPRDGFQQIVLKNSDATATDKSADSAGGSYITAFPPPRNEDLSTFSAHQNYEISVNHPTVVEIPYRSTLKKLQASWTGRLPGVHGAAALEDMEGRFRLAGKLVNQSGRTLNNVYFIYTTRVNPIDPLTIDQMYYQSDWKTDSTVDLKQLVKDSKEISANGPLRDGKTIERGTLGHYTLAPYNWNEFLQAPWSTKQYAEEPRLDDLENRVPRSFAILSLYDHIPLVNPKKLFRPELARLGLRYLDASADLSAGSLVILAQASGGLPMPMEVGGRPINGEGTTFYQFVVPLDRTAWPLTPPPATIPAVQPITQPTSNMGPSAPGGVTAEIQIHQMPNSPNPATQTFH